MSDKITVGPYTGGRRDSTRKGLYGKQRSGKMRNNGGFSGEPTVGYTKISEERWNAIDWTK